MQKIKSGDTPLISVIIPTFNQEKFIGETIQSVISQSYKNWELLVVDDCSVDDSWNIIKKFTEIDSRIKVFRNEKNIGLIENLRFLIDASVGEYIAFLEGDDIFYKHNLSSKIEVLKNNSKLGMVYCNFDVIDEKGDILIDNYYAKSNIKTYKNEKITPENFMLLRNAPMSSYGQLMIKRDVLIASGYPRSLDEDEKVFLPSDWDFNFRISTENNIYGIDEVLLGYRKHLNNSSSKTLKVSKQILMILDDYSKKFENNENILSAIKYMRGKTHYFNIIYYIENNEKNKAWREFLFYIFKYPYNIVRDSFLNFKLIVRLFLPDKINDIIRIKYCGK